MCVWHDADADLLFERLKVKCPPLPDGRTTSTVFAIALSEEADLKTLNVWC